MLSLELYGAGIANRRVSAMWVVPSLDEREDRCFASAGVANRFLSSNSHGLPPLQWTRIANRYGGSVNSNLVVFVILGIAFVAVGLHLVLYSRRRAADIRRFADSHGCSYKARDDGTLERQLGNAFGIEESGCVRTFGQVSDIVSLPNGTIFRAVELMDLNPHASVANSHHMRTAVQFSGAPEGFGIFHITTDLAVHQRFPHKTGAVAESIRKMVQRREMAVPPHPLSLTLMHGQGLAYLEPPIVGSVTQHHLNYLADLAAQLSKLGS